MEFEFDSVEAVLEDIRRGKLVIVTDDEGRENEGDLLCAAEKITPGIINFMITHAKGLVCAPITEQRAKELGIFRPPSTDHFKTAFTESVDARPGRPTFPLRNGTREINHICARRFLKVGPCVLPYGNRKEAAAWMRSDRNPAGESSCFPGLPCPRPRLFSCRSSDSTRRSIMP